ncbi:TBC1 domain family member 25 [Struthio camelus]|uniref:TBC1 domain family member 25 n=1 Tax=Struthio camelus TaxID=8801 RepID=UPI003603E433
MAAAGGGAWTGGGAALEEECEVVRVRVKKSEGLLPPEFRSFAVDPQITSLDVLQHILARAFDLQGKKSFAVSFAARDRRGHESFTPLASDSDLAAAFASAAKPALRLRLDVRPPDDSPLLEDWDIISPREAAGAEPPGPERRSLLAAALPFTQALLAQVGRTLARAQAALAWPEGSPPPPASPPPPPRAPLSDADLRSYLGPGGRLARPRDLRLHVYHGGVEPGLRKVVWRYLLNVFPAGLSGQERLAHLRRKAAEYGALKARLAAQAAPGELALVGAAVRKDVVRTDRGHPYFGGPEEGHPHLAALQALLTTFALGHPRLSYCQGMSDVAAPLLAVLDDEAQAFICFCALMRRLAPRFRPGGRGLARAFGHLRRLLRRADPPFWAFLAARGAHDLLFCYRWLLLELKREFAFEDALRVLEITWSSLPPAPPPPADGVPLLGAPLGPRRARCGLRERRGLRPRPPRRHRRQCRAQEAATLGARGAEKEPGDDAEGLSGLGDVLEAPKSCGNLQEDPKVSRDVQEDPNIPTNAQEDPKISDVQDAAKVSTNIQEDLKVSQGAPGSPEISQDGGAKSEVPDNPETNRGVTEDLHVSRDIPEDPKASREARGGPGVPKKADEDPDIPKEVGQDPNTPKEVDQDLSIFKEAEQDCDVPQKLSQGLNVPKVGPEPDIYKEVGQDFGVTKEIGQNLNAFEEVRQDLNVPQEVGQDLSILKEVGQEPSVFKKVGQDPGAFKEIGQELRSPQKVGQDPDVPEDAEADAATLPEVGEADDDPWAGPWAWEDSSSSSSSSSSCSSSSSSEDEVGVEDDGAPLPPPEELGQGNPFLLFVCLAMLLEQREAVMARASDYNEVAMHFDRLVRRHDLPRVLHRAKALFARYLEGWGGRGGPGAGDSDPAEP